MRRAEREASRLLNELGITSPPVPVHKIVRHVGVHIAKQKFTGDVSGILFREDGEATIGVNRDHHKHRQRFTIAHELGHYLLHPGQPLIVDKQVRVNYRDRVSSLATDRQEIEANAFAAQLLMPDRLVTDLAERLLAGDPSMDDETLVESLNGRFDVSAQAMRYRLANLGVISVW